MRTFFVLDSLWNSDNIVNYNYEISLMCEMMRMQDHRFDESYFQLSNVITPIEVTAQQTNFSDCGLYVCHWALEIMTLMMYTDAEISRLISANGGITTAQMDNQKIKLRADLYEITNESVPDELRESILSPREK